MTRAVALVLVVALFAAQAPKASAGPKPPIRPRDTLDQIDPRRLPYQPRNELAEHPQNMRPSIGANWVWRGHLRTSSWLDLTGRTMSTLNSRRAVPDVAGRMNYANNRTIMLRDRSFHPRR